MVGFGPHLVLDGHGCRKKKLQDLNLIYRILDEFPAGIGMTKIMPPYVFRYGGGRPEDWGISGFVLVAESHVSIHTFPEKCFISVRIFSGGSFDSELATDLLKKTFEMERVEQRMLDRGTEFPKTINGAAEIVRSERLRITAPIARTA